MRSLLVLVFLLAACRSSERLIRSFPIAGDHPSPIVIAGIKLKDQAIRFDQPFQAKGAWIYDLKITVRNASARHLASASIKLDLYSPDRSWITGTQIKSGPLKPGQSTEISFDQESRRLLLAQSPSFSPESVREIIISPHTAIFDDGHEAWIQGYYKERSFSDPSLWITKP
jgi:hypothetical protein